MSITIPYRVRLADTDAAGVVYFAHLLHTCHIAYEEALIQCGINLHDYLQAGTTAIPIVHGEIDCFHPVFWGDLIFIALTPQLLSKTHFTIDYELIPDNDRAKLLARGQTQHISIDPQTRQRVPLPHEIQEKFIGANQ